MAATIPALAEASDIVTFTQALLSEVPEVSGRSIAELIGTSPLFPPVEGLPKEFWQGQSCSNCHQWTQASICEQANTYLSLNMQRSLTKTASVWRVAETAPQNLGGGRLSVALQVLPLGG